MMSAPGPGSMNSPRSARTSESISVFVCSFAETLSSNANTARTSSVVNPAGNPRVSSKAIAASDPVSTNHRTASSTTSRGNARTPNSGRSNDATIFNKSICSPADDARPNTCRPVGISRCSISSNCSYSAKTRASRLVESLVPTGDLYRLANGRRELHKLRLKNLREPPRLFARLKLLLRIDDDHARARLPQRETQLPQFVFDLQMTQRADVETVASQWHVRAAVGEQ